MQVHPAYWRLALRLVWLGRLEQGEAWKWWAVQWLTRGSQMQGWMQAPLCQGFLQRSVGMCCCLDRTYWWPGLGSRSSACRSNTEFSIACTGWHFVNDRRGWS